MYYILACTSYLHNMSYRYSTYNIMYIWQDDSTYLCNMLIHNILHMTYVIYILFVYITYIYEWQDNSTYLRNMLYYTYSVYITYECMHLCCTSNPLSYSTLTFTCRLFHFSYSRNFELREMSSPLSAQDIRYWRPSRQRWTANSTYVDMVSEIY